MNFIFHNKKIKIKARKPREAKEVNVYFKDTYNLAQH